MRTCARGHVPPCADVRVWARHMDRDGAGAGGRESCPGGESWRMVPRRDASNARLHSARRERTHRGWHQGPAPIRCKERAPRFPLLLV
eukprot:2067369-Prymnesium_polylepis.2